MSAQNTTQPAIERIDIVSDVVCPWCIIGYLQLRQALDARGLTPELYWHPFELNPDMPPEGQNLREHLMQKYGTTKAQSDQARQRLTSLGEDLGFAFNFSPEMRMHNTFNAHQLLHWARELGATHRLKQALFVAHFSHRRDLSDSQVLADICAEAGLDRDAALEVVSSQRFAATVRQAEQHWLRQGIQGVPAVIFNQRHLVTGAQGADNYGAILDQLSAAEVAE